MDRRRACRLGSYAFADRHGVFGCHVIVRVGPSTVCDGVGCFATRFLPKGTPVTVYAGRARKTIRGLSDRDLAYTYTRAAPYGDNIVGYRDKRRLNGRGVAQLTNDAVHPEVTGRTNNCILLQRPCDGRVYLVADADIRPGEELLVSYHISYWTYRAASPELPQHVRSWAARHAGVESALAGPPLFCKSIERYHGTRRVHARVSDDGLRVCISEGGREWDLLEYTLLYERPSATPGCACNCALKKRSVRKCQVLLQLSSTRRVAAWRCSQCQMVDFLLLDSPSHH